MQDNFVDIIFSEHQKCGDCPTSHQISTFFDSLLGVFFPNFSSNPVKSKKGLVAEIVKLKSSLEKLSKLGKEEIESFFSNGMPKIYQGLQGDIDAINEGDPAAKSREEVIRSYPGFYAIAAYRIANELLKRNVSILPRTITELAHGKTGIDIHPGATIGNNFCIDHGTGVVIGETTQIGNNVKMYQGVTVGALSVDKNFADKKRHPTIEDDVVIYSGATILGGDTVIGKGSIIGGNVWITKSIPQNSRVYYVPQIEQKVSDHNDLITSKL